MMHATHTDTPTGTHGREGEAKAGAKARRKADDGKIILYWLEFTNPDVAPHDPAALMGGGPI
jgi:hypothetical protein